MHRQGQLRNEAGYTLLEAILQLVIFALFAQLFVLFFYWKAPIDQQYKNKSVVAWEIFVADFQGEITSVDGLEIIQSGEGIRFRTERGTITLELKNGVIRKAIGGLGHVPLLTEIEQASFTLTDKQLTVEVMMQDGTLMERDFIVGQI